MCVGRLRCDLSVTHFRGSPGLLRTLIPYDALCRFFFSSRRRHTRFDCDWSSDVCSSDLWVAAVATSVVTGEGLDQLRHALQRVAGDLLERPADDLFRLPIDRVFAVAGAGTDRKSVV